jgi:hypothetical protein
MKRPYLLAVSSIIIITIVIVLTLMQVRSVRSGPQASTPTPPLDGPNTSQLNPSGTSVLHAGPTAVQPKITDLAPDIPYDDKPSVAVQHADGSKERYLLAPNAVDAFLKNLPRGDKLLGVIPPPSMLGNPQPPLSTEVP